MTGSRINPNMFRGEEVSGGIIGKNDKPSSATSPEWKGKIYLAGVGWYWVSGWVHEGSRGEYLRLAAQEMTDEQAKKFCVPKPHRGGKGAAPIQQHGLSNRTPVRNPKNEDGEIPF